MRYSKAEVRGIVSQLDIEAKMAGLLPMDHKLVYNAGNGTNGISATVMVQGPNGNYVHGFDRFIPQFTYKTGPTEQARLLEAALNVFYALRVQKEDAAKAARRQLAERAARLEEEDWSEPTDKYNDRHVTWTDPDGGNTYGAHILSYDSGDETFFLSLDNGGEAEVPRTEVEFS